ncbi:MAG: VanZ family protein, partial [Rhizobiales bacterium]|nr:VanZ family protein [Hyphomicrobiales bacterium]
GLRPRLGYGPDFARFVGFLVSGPFLGSGYRRRWLWMVGIIAVAAFGIETLQYLTPDRHARFWDATVKASGGILGVLAAHMVLVLGTS